MRAAWSTPASPAQRPSIGNSSSIVEASLATCLPSNGPSTSRMSSTAATLTACGRVWSWICVNACRRPTTTPTITVAMSAGAETIRTSISAVLTLDRMMSLFIAFLHADSAVAQDQSVQQARPAVDADEQKQFQRHRYQCRRHHDHAHRHQDVGDHEVDNQERQVEQETDLERPRQLRADERGQQHDEIILLEVGASFRRP